MSPARVVRFALAVVMIASGTGTRSRALAQSASALPNPYRVIDGWAQMPEGRKMGATNAIEVDPDGRSIWVADRCGPAANCAGTNIAPIMKFDASGKLVASFGAGLFVRPHGIAVDPQGNVWVTDEITAEGKGQQVIKFSPSGAVLLALGKAGVAGDGPDTFNAPSDVAIAPNGDIFVADGHGGKTNARIVKFSRDGRFIKAWGQRGTGPGEFDTPHGLAFDSQGRLFVVDRTQQRIQIFSQDGQVLGEWKQFGRLSGIHIDKNDIIYIADQQSGIRIGSAKDGTLIGVIPGPDGGGISVAEAVTTDAEGNVFAAEVSSQTVKKYVKK